MKIEERLRIFKSLIDSLPLTSNEYEIIIKAWHESNQS